MRNLSKALLAVVFAAAVVVACADQPMPTQDVPDVRLSEDNNAADQYWYPVELEDFDLCGYDVVDFVGTGHSVAKGTWQDEGGGWHARYRERWKLTGVGQGTGETWTWNEHFDWSSNWAEELPGQDEATMLWYVNIVGHDQAPDFKMHFQLHYTYNANGELAAFKIVDRECD